MALPFVFAEELSGSVDTGSTTTGTVITGNVTTTGDIITGSTTTGTVSTGTTTTGNVYFSGDIKNGYGKIRGYWKLIYEDFGYMWKFFKKPLTGDALSGAKAVIKEKNQAIKTLNQEMKSAMSSSGTIDWTGYTDKFIAVYETFRTNALVYVASGKVEKFNAYIDWKITTLKNNLAYKIKSVQAKEKAYIKQQEVKHQKELKKQELKKQQEMKKSAQKATQAAKKAAKKGGK
ncbi:TPA: hypothetical protein DEP21_05815 [Patescibacteria group bacterium]|nr:hypothetical protein [Candidatus Gracilibacteria bacterium]